MANQELHDLVSDGIVADEREHCKHLEHTHKLAKEKGYTVGSGVDLPELNPDGSEVEVAQDDQKPTGTADKA